MRNAEVDRGGAYLFSPSLIAKESKILELQQQIEGWKLQNEELQVQLKEANQQIKYQQELINILLDRLESNDPYYNEFLEEEELTTYKNKYQ